MDEAEARALLDAEVERLRALAYEELKNLLDAEAEQITGSSGTMYTIETQAFGDDPRGHSGDIRVMVSIDDGRGWRAFAPLTTSFIRAPDGSFVGEND
jgi:hypothetical protein